jgi:hypothetical protein
MRVLFMAMLIALLPLRGWVGDAMALQPGKHDVQPAAALTAVTDVQDCHDHAEAAGHGADQGGHETGSAHADCGSCSACQICHSPALAVAPPAAFASPDMAAAMPRFAPRPLASAEPAPDIKPPIS